MNEVYKTVGLGKPAKFRGERRPGPWKVTMLWASNWGRARFKSVYGRTSLVVKWLRVCAPKPGAVGLIPSQGTKIPHAMRVQLNNKWIYIFFNVHVENVEFAKYLLVMLAGAHGVCKGGGRTEKDETAKSTLPTHGGGKWCQAKRFECFCIGGGRGKFDVYF